MRRYEKNILVGATAFALSLSHVSCAQEPAKLQFDIAAQDLKYSLRELAKQAGLELAAPSEPLAGRHANALHGRFTTGEALLALLKDTGLEANIVDGAILITARSKSVSSVGTAETERSDIVVTGSRIRGAPVASPTIRITHDEMVNSGRTRLADVIRDIPQNFGGGVNPGIGVGVPEDKGLNLGGGSSINLRGLGPDATLTLLNGHRLAYNISTQAIDISVIPVDAVDRIEIVADGASALYGSDAVGGVANIILKSDYDGLAVSSRVAGSTSGGNFQQQYGAVGGRTWANGGILVAYEFERDTAIFGRQRSYTRDRPALTLYPHTRRNNVIVSGHQAISPDLSLNVDTLYNRRRTRRSYANSAAANYQIAGNKAEARSMAYAIAPSLVWRPGDLELSLTGMYGADRSHYGADNYRNGALSSQTRGCYCNKAQSLEFSGAAPLLALDGGDAKLAFGGGYRNNDFHGFRTKGSAQDIRASQDSYFGFAELNLPLIGPQTGLHLVNRLNVSAALRYEDYPGIDRVTTPKLGIIFAPNEDIDIKGSWGQSFKAPTLYQRFNSTAAEIDPAADLGAKGVAPTASAILLYGGNSRLKPERATTWTATLVAHPRAVPGLTLEVGYFKVRYKDRIVEPITFLAQALSNPIYRDLVLLNPSATAQQAALAGATIYDYTEEGYDPANVLAIIYDTSLNVARQDLHGIDGSLRYQTALGKMGDLTLSGAASYLKSKQQLSALQPDIALAGSIFNPPHFRGKLGATWAYGPAIATINASYIGPVKDVRTAPTVQIGSMTQFDFTGRYTWGPESGVLQGFSIAISVLNIANAKPDGIRTSRLAESPYDSTNYSASGRVAALSLSKKW
ncbi:hypothetical protein BH10PSE12_BH10PSE12_08520 [soil metagenome]